MKAVDRSVSQAVWCPSDADLKQTRVAIAGLSQLFREGLCQLLCRSHLVVGTAQSLEDVLREHDGGSDRPELVILGLDRGNGALAQLALVRKYRAELLGCRIVLLVESMDAILIGQAAASGADALLSRDISGEVLQRSLELVYLGQQLFPAPLAHALSDNSKREPSVEMMPFQWSSRAPVPPVPPVLLNQQTAMACSDPDSTDQHCSTVLSMRESQVLRRVAAGLSNKMIARELNITEATVKVHVKALFRKLHLKNRTQAAIWASSKIPVRQPLLTQTAIQ